MEKISKESYFKKMKETSQLTEQHLSSILRTKIKNPKLMEDFLFFIKRRQDKAWARPWVLRMAYELGGGKEWKTLIKLGAILELENISNYQSNSSFDFKYGITEENLRMRQIIVSFISRNLVQKFIEESMKNEKLFLKVSKSIYDIDYHNYTGQFYEFDELHIKNFDMNLSFEGYLKIYLKRCFYYGGIWLKNCLYLGYTFAGKEDLLSLKILEWFGSYLGTGWMILNDITDYFIKAEKHSMNYKIASDEFKDIWNGRVTLPIFHALKNSSDKEKGFLLDVLRNKIEKNEDNMRKVFEVLLENGSLNFSYSLANWFRKEAKKIIKKFPLSKRHYLSIFADAIKTNKFVYEYRKVGLKVIPLPKNIQLALQNESKNNFS